MCCKIIEIHELYCMFINTMGLEIVVRVKTQQIVVEESEDENELPLRKWMITICMLNKDGEEVSADIIAHCIYYLHKTFENPVQKYTEPPFTIIEEGWGEFSIKIICKLIAKSGKFTIYHDLLFQENAYAVDYSVQVPLNIGKLRAVLQKNFTLPENPMEGLTKSNRPRLSWGKVLPTFDEDMITEFTQIILNDPSVKAEIDRHDRTEKVYLYFGQFPNELLEKLVEYTNTVKKKNKELKLHEGESLSEKDELMENQLEGLI